MAKSQRKTARSADGKGKTDAHAREKALEQREAELTKREETVRERIADLARAEQELEDHRHTLAATLPPPPATPEPALAPSPKPPLSATVRRSVPLVLGAALAVVAATLTYTAIAPTYDVRAEWQRTDGAPLPIETVRDIALASQASAEDEFDVQDARWLYDDTTATVVATFRTRDPARFSTAINTRAHAALPAIAEAVFPGAPAADAVATLIRQRDAMRDELAALPSTDPSAEATVARDELDRLLADTNELAAAREATSQELARVQTARTAIEQPASRPTATSASIAPDAREQAFAEDRELSQASQRLTAELTAIRAHLNEAITAARPKLGEARRGLDAFLQETRTQREAPPDASAETELDAIGAEANRLAGQIATLDETLAEAGTELTRIADPTMTQRAIETAAKAYTAAAGAAMASLTQRVQALGDGGEQLTKRLVARSALANALRRLQMAQDDLNACVQQTTIASNFRLETAIQRAAAAAEVVATRRTFIDNQLQEEAHRRAEADRQARLTALQHEADTLTAQLDERRNALAVTQTRLFEAMRAWTAAVERAEAKQAAQQTRLAIRDRLAAAEEALAAARSQAAHHLDGIRFTPATYAPRPVNRQGRAAWSLAAGSLAFGITVGVPYARRRFKPA